MKFTIFSDIKNELAFDFLASSSKSLRIIKPFGMLFLGDGKTLSHLASSMYSLYLREYEDRLRTYFFAAITLAL